MNTTVLHTKEMNKFLFLKKHVFNKKQYFRHDYDQYELKPLNNFIFWMSYLTDKNCSGAENPYFCSTQWG
jgi:hypothetical protein